MIHTLFKSFFYFVLLLVGLSCQGQKNQEQAQNQQSKLSAESIGERWYREQDEHMPCFRGYFRKLNQLRKQREETQEKERIGALASGEKTSAEFQEEMRQVLIEMFNNEKCCEDFNHFWMVKLQELRDYINGEEAAQSRQRPFDPPPENDGKINIPRIFGLFEDDNISNHWEKRVFDELKAVPSEMFFGKFIKGPFGNLDSFLEEMGPCSGQLRALIEEMRKFINYSYVRTGVSPKEGRPAFPGAQPD